MREHGENAFPASGRIPDGVEARHEATRPRLCQQARCRIAVELVEHEGATEMKGSPGEESRGV